MNMKKVKYNGSLTVEAAIILPIFLYCIIGFLYFLQMIFVYEAIQNSITNIGLEVARFGYVYDVVMNQKSKSDETSSDNNNDHVPLEIKEIGERLGINIKDLFTSSMLGVYIKDRLADDRVNASIIRNGMEGIHTYFSSFMEEDNRIDIIVHYKIDMPFGILTVTDIPIIQRVTMRGWVPERIAIKDSNKSNQDGNYVYVTETGSAYHKNDICTYINIKINKILFRDLTTGGRSYAPCDVCIRQNNSTLIDVYITRTGDKYHSTSLCRSLKRTVRKILIEEAEGYHPCSRCYLRGENVNDTKYTSYCSNNMASMVLCRRYKI